MVLRLVRGESDERVACVLIIFEVVICEPEIEQCRILMIDRKRALELVARLRPLILSSIRLPEPEHRFRVRRIRVDERGELVDGLHRLLETEQIYLAG